MAIDYYAILGVPVNASLEEIRRAYHRQAFAAHPDRGGSHRQMLRINEAWEVLGNADKRREYDVARQPAARPERPAHAATAARPAHGATAGRPAGRSRPRAKAGGPRVRSLTEIAAAILGKALRALGGFGEPKARVKRKVVRSRGVVIVRCKRCGQRLRVRHAGGANVRCPKCKSSVASR